MNQAFISALGVIVDPDWMGKASEHIMRKRLDLMTELWKESFRHSMAVFEQRLRIETRDRVAEWLRAEAEKQEAPESNWLYQIGADGTLHKNPNWRADR